MEGSDCPDDAESIVVDFEALIDTNFGCSISQVVLE